MAELEAPGILSRGIYLVILIVLFIVASIAIFVYMYFFMVYDQEAVNIAADEAKSLCPSSSGCVNACVKDPSCVDNINKAIADKTRACDIKVNAIVRDGTSKYYELKDTCINLDTPDDKTKDMTPDTMSSSAYSYLFDTKINKEFNDWKTLLDQIILKTDEYNTLTAGSGDCEINTEENNFHTFMESSGYQHGINYRLKEPHELDGMNPAQYTLSWVPDKFPNMAKALEYINRQMDYTKWIIQYCPAKAGNVFEKDGVYYGGYYRVIENTSSNIRIPDNLYMWNQEGYVLYQGQPGLRRP